MGQRGVPPHLTYAQVRACHALYLQGQSLRQIARVILPRTPYASVGSCAEALRVQFVHLGLPRRPQGAATAAANMARGSGLTRRELRVAAGEILDRPQCAGTKTQGGRRGSRCQLRAMADSDFCAAHDPACAGRRDAHLAAMRATRDAAKAAA